jgi:hypothetical protein
MFGLSLVQYSVSLPDTRRACRCNANVDVKTTEGHSALSFAASNGQAQVRHDLIVGTIDLPGAEGPIVHCAPGYYSS